MTKVPASKFRRELRKWLRHIDRSGESVVITQRFGPDLICKKVVDIASESVYIDIV